MITQKLLHELFEYKNGELYWKKTIAKKTKINSKAGHIKKNKYKVIGINGKTYPTQRLIYMMFYGYMPIEVDHDDNNPSNNKIENLRAATTQENQYNSKLRIDNNSGIKGVTWYAKTKKWQAQLRVNGKPKHFGYYFDKEVARFVVEAMRCKFHGNFANNGE